MLKIESLTRRYPHVTALDGLNMEIGHGQLYGFVGPNGAGKTTTIRIISGLLRPTSGKVWIDVNTPKGDEDGPDDSYVRKACIKSRVPYITTMAAALASADGILAEQKQEKNEVVSLQELHSRIREK